VSVTLNCFNELTDDDKKEFFDNSVQAYVEYLEEMKEKGKKIAYVEYLMPRGPIREACESSITI
jgi:hypothetical protein